MSTSNTSGGGGRRHTVKRRPSKSRPSSKTAHSGQRKLKPKTKAKRKTRSRTTSMSSKYSGGAKRKSTSRSSSRRKHSAPRESVKELAFMGNDRMRLGLVPPLPLQLALDPELKRKVQMSDPRVRDIFSRYGPGWTGYQIGIQSNINQPTVTWERKLEGFPAVGLDPRLHPLHPKSLGALGMNVPTGFVGSNGKKQDLDALFVGSVLGTNVNVMDKDRLPGENFNVKSGINIYGLAPEIIRSVGLTKRKIPKVGAVEKITKSTPPSSSLRRPLSGSTLSSASSSTLSSASSSTSSSPSSSPRDVGDFKIVIQLINGTKFDLYVNKTDTIMDVKKQISKKEKIPNDSFRLIFKGKTLEDTKTLESCGVKENDVIHLVTRLKKPPISSPALPQSQGFGFGGPVQPQPQGFGFVMRSGEDQKEINLLYTRIRDELLKQVPVYTQQIDQDFNRIINKHGKQQEWTNYWNSSKDNVLYQGDSNDTKHLKVRQSFLLWEINKA
jgi:Ubiquitin family